MKYYLTSSPDFLTKDGNIEPSYSTVRENIIACSQIHHYYNKGYSMYAPLGVIDNYVEKKDGEKDNDPYLNYWEKFCFEFSQTVPTSDPEHIGAIQEIMTALQREGYLYKNDNPNFDGLKELLPDDVFENTGTYWFALSQFKDDLLEAYETDKIVLRPNSCYDKVIALIENLKDIPATKVGTAVKTGVKLSCDEKQVVQPCLDGLFLPMTSVGYGSNNEQFLEYWPCDMHVVSEDTLFLQCVVWPALLIAFNKTFDEGGHYIDLPSKIVCVPKVEANHPVDTNIDISLSPDAFYYYFQNRPLEESFVYSKDDQDKVYSDRLVDMSNFIFDVREKIHDYFDSCIPEFPHQDDNEGFFGELSGAQYLDILEVNLENLRFPEYYNQIFNLVEEAKEYFKKLPKKPKEPIKSDESYGTEDAIETVRFFRRMVAYLRLISLSLVSPLMMTSFEIYRGFHFETEWENLEEVSAWKFLHTVVNDPFYQFDKMIYYTADNCEIFPELEELKKEA